MKKSLLVFALAFSIMAKAQLKEGRIVYERTIQMALRTFRDLDPEIAKQIPRSRTDQFELLFANNQSLWQNLPTAENESGEQTFGGGGMVVRFASMMSEVSFIDLTKGTRLDQREAMNRTFLVSDSLKKLDWKLSDESKTILTYNCKKATSTRITTRFHIEMENGEMKRKPVQDTQTVVAWYTTDIPTAIGPDYAGQLPGAILELDIANGQTIYKAIEISPKVNTRHIKAPKEGKKLTAEEFLKEREKLMDEMQKNIQERGGEIRIQRS